MAVYVLAVDGAVVKYPYTLTDMRRDNPEVSFPADVSDDLAAGFNVFHVDEVPEPQYDPDTQYIVWVNPDYAEGKWAQKWSIADYTPEEIAQRLQQWRDQTTCSPFQGRMALIDAGLLANAEAAVNAADDKTKTAWEYALVWQRSSPMIEALAGALSLTDVQVDDLFKAAQQITA